MLLKVVTLCAISLATVAAQADASNDTSVERNIQAFTNSLIVPDIIPSYDPIGVVSATFATVGQIVDGQPIPVADAQVKPNISIAGTPNTVESGGGSFIDFSRTLFTLMMIDGFAPGNTNNTSLVRHYLQNNMTAINTNGTLTFTNSTPAITDYKGPAPPAGSGPHRYIILVLSQTEAFSPPEEYSTPGLAVGRWDPNAYIDDADLMILGATYFTTENGVANISVASTSALPSTDAAGSTVANSPAPTAAPTTSAPSGGASAPATTSTRSAGGKNGVTIWSALGAVAVGMLALA